MKRISGDYSKKINISLEEENIMKNLVKIGIGLLTTAGVVALTVMGLNPSAVEGVEDAMDTVTEATEEVVEAVGEIAEDDIAD